MRGKGMWTTALPSRWLSYSGTGTGKEPGTFLPPPKMEPLQSNSKLSYVRKQNPQTVHWGTCGPGTGKHSACGGHLYTLYSVPYSPTLHTLYLTPYTALHPTTNTLQPHPILPTLYPIPHTPQPIPHTPILHPHPIPYTPYPTP